MSPSSVLTAHPDDNTFNLAESNNPASSSDQATAEKLYAEQYEQYAQQYQAWAAANPGYHQTPEAAAQAQAADYAAYYQHYQQQPPAPTAAAPGTQQSLTPEELYAQQYAAYYAQYGYPTTPTATSGYPEYYAYPASTAGTAPPAASAPYPYPGYPQTAPVPTPQPPGTPSLTHYPSYSHPQPQSYSSSTSFSAAPTPAQGAQTSDPYAQRGNQPQRTSYSQHSNSYLDSVKAPGTSGGHKKPSFDFQAFQRQKHQEAEERKNLKPSEALQQNIQHKFQDISLEDASMKKKADQPLYHSVKAKKAKPTTTNVLEPKSEAASAANNAGWPQSLKDYVQRVFETIADSDRDKAQAELKAKVSKLHAAGKLWETDWDLMPIPSEYKRRGKRNHTSASPEPQQFIPDIERERREKRMKRFEQQLVDKPATTPVPELREPPVYNSDVIDWDQHTIVGTCTKLEKGYLRLTSAPDPSTVRPPHVLQKTLQLLKEKWREDANYTYICDQFKSVRQDLTVQRIKNELTVSVYEIHARIALEKGDLGEFNQCQTQLKELYEHNIPGNVMEFTAYRILYQLHTRNYLDIIAVLASLTPVQKGDAAVKHALQVRTALSSSNYYSFFKLYAAAPNMGGYLMDQFVDRERVEAMKSICKAYRPDIKVEFLQNILGFVTVEECQKFMRDINIQNLIAYGVLDTRNAFPRVVQAGQKFLTVDLKGQI
ncbi:hypothetical protein BG004_002685 [Podila humilis]|nr:hypothetical protein BG004_002685 [Podila humilis]